MHEAEDYPGPCRWVDSLALTMAEGDGNLDAVGAGKSPKSVREKMDKADQNRSDDVCPVTGVKDAEDFRRMDMFTKLLIASGEELCRAFALPPGALDSKGDKSSSLVSYSISDPAGEDCPLVHVSSGFEDLTGYTTDYSTGRNCRFLQPLSRLINDAFNWTDRKEMRAFCFDPQQTGKTIIHLLLNENAITGQRFWNLLRLQYVGFEGRQYIFGVQTTIDAYMPRTLAKRWESLENNRNIVDNLADFRAHLAGMRQQLKTMSHSPIFELKGYLTAMLNHVRMAIKVNATPSTPSTESDLGSKPKERKLAPVARGGVGIVKGVKVRLLADVKYASGDLKKGTTGMVKAIDAFGTATIDFGIGMGTKGVLKKDLKMLEKVQDEFEERQVS
jgi:hypothetical protein